MSPEKHLSEDGPEQPPTPQQQQQLAREKGMAVDHSHLLALMGEVLAVLTDCLACQYWDPAWLGGTDRFYQLASSAIYLASCISSEFAGKRQKRSPVVNQSQLLYCDM